VKQELWGIFLAYNLIRLEMTRIAVEADVEPTRISFVEALRLIRDEWEWLSVTSPGAISQSVWRLCAATSKETSCHRAGPALFPELSKWR
jgi:hypothetical protein